MIINVPYMYELKAVPLGKLKERDFDIIDTVPVEIEEYSSDEVNLVATFMGKNWGSETYFEHSYIEKNGDFFAKKWVGDRKPEHFTVGPDLWTEAQLSRRYSEDIPKLWSREWYRADGAIEGLDPANFKSLGASTRDDVATGIVENASKFIFVDGVLHQRATEPVITLKTSGRWNGGRLHRWLDVEFMDKVYDGDRDSTYRLDRLDWLLADMNERRMLEEEEQLSADRLQIEVYRPDLIYFDRERKFLDRHMTHFFESAVKRLPEADRGELMAYADARDAIRAVDPNSDDGVYEAIEACRALVFASDRTPDDYSVRSFELSAELWLQDPLRGLHNDDMSIEEDFSVKNDL